MIIWEKIGELWPYLKNLSEGICAQVVIADEPSRLFIVSVIADDTRWRTSMLLNGVHSEQGGFSTSEEAQHAAERALTESLVGFEVDALADPWGSPLEMVEVETLPRKDPFREVAALLTCTVLRGNEQLSHISEYKREWVAVCLSPDGHLEDYAFQRDSDTGAMGMRLKGDRLEVLAA